MSLSQILSTAFEFILVSFTIWAVFHEDYFVALEEKLFAAVKRRRLRVVKSDSSGKSSHTSAYNFQNP